jgi:hypothetical protein
MTASAHVVDRNERETEKEQRRDCSATALCQRFEIGDAAD